jgi:hypothetical protein
MFHTLIAIIRKLLAVNIKLYVSNEHLLFLILIASSKKLLQLNYYDNFVKRLNFNLIIT